MSEARRAALLVALTTIAIALPAAAWWSAGMSDAAERAANHERELRRRAELEARSVATRASGALARVADLENRRPWRHYASLDALQEAPWRPDPLVLAHFEIQPQGAVRLTEIGPEAAGDLPPAALLCSLRDELGTRVPELWRAVLPECAAETPALPLPGEKGMTCVGPLTWTTVTLAGVPRLVGVRHVERPDGSLTQGVVIDDAAWREAAAGTERAVLRPGPPEGEAAAPIALLGSAWHAAIDEGPLRLSSEEHARDLRSAFTHAYGFGVTVAGLAGLAATAMAWQALRLARRRAELTAIAAHELRTPLAGIRLHAGMLASGLGDPSRLREQARRVSDEAWRLSRVVHNLLDSAGRGDSGMAVRAEAGDLGATLRSAVATVAPALEAAGARILVELPDDLPPARFDAEATTRILHDLLDNAEKYARGRPDRSIVVAASPRSERGAVEVVVDDAGPGIPPEDRPRAFRPFSRLRRRDVPSGLGLGLALARARARAMGGELTCTDSERGGARMVLTLPVATVAAGA